MSIIKCTYAQIGKGEHINIDQHQKFRKQEQIKRRLIELYELPLVANKTIGSAYFVLKILILAEQNRTQ